MSSTITSKELDRVYEYEDTGLDEGEALDRYTEEKAKNPGSIVSIEVLGCGHHFTVKVYKTEGEKRHYYQKTLRNLFGNLWDAIKT